MSAPQAWRIIGDHHDVFAYIPTDGTDRSRRIAERVATMTSADMAEVAAKWLAENYPNDPYLSAYRDAAPSST